MNILVIGLSLAAVLFLLSAGLTLIFGMLGVINFAHGSFYMLGAYLGFQVVETTGNFWVALVVAPLLAALVGAVVERLVLHPVYDREPHYQMLLTFGIILILEEAVRAIWGLDYKEVGAPAILAAPTHLLGATVSTYRLFIIGFGAAAATLLFVVLDKTRVGVVVRAASSDPEMVRSGTYPRLSPPETTSSSISRRRSFAPWSRCSSKIACLMSLIASSRDETASSSRARTVGETTRREADCRDSPVANSLWMTWSCMSRAIRSRSSRRATRARDSWPRAAIRAKPT